MNWKEILVIIRINWKEVLVIIIIVLVIGAIGFFAGRSSKKLNYADCEEYLKGFPQPKPKDILIYISDSTGYKTAIDSLQTELKNCNNESYFVSSQYLKLRKQIEIVTADSMKNAEDYSYIKEYKKENNLK